MNDGFWEFARDDKKFWNSVRDVLRGTRPLKDLQEEMEIKRRHYHHALKEIDNLGWSASRSKPLEGSLRCPCCENDFTEKELLNCNPQIIHIKIYTEADLKEMENQSGPTSTRPV